MGNLISCTTQKVNTIYKPVLIEELQNIKEPIAEEEIKIEETVIEESVIEETVIQKNDEDLNEEDNVDDINEKIFTETTINEENVECLEKINNPVVSEKPISIEERL
jgi:hypothetical protein